MPQTLPIIPFSEFRPDVTDYDGETSKDITNVVPRGDGYGPFFSLSGYTAALPAAARGTFYARKNDGTITIFAGTINKLYALNATSFTWTDVSLGASTYSSLSSGANWSFAQFNNFVFATQANAVLQVFDLTSPSAFANASGSPPQAAYVAVVNRFLVLSGLATPNVYRIQWSGLNDVNSSSSWTSGVNSSDFQDLADGGIVRGVAGGEYGVIFQDTAIRSMNFAPGSPFVFTIERIASDDGLLAPYSLLNVGTRIFWLSAQGFRMMDYGQPPTLIGKERVDRTFFNDADLNNLQLIIGTSDPNSTRVMWTYKSVAGQAGLFDKILCYDWGLDRFTILKVSGEYLDALARPGVTLESVDAAYGDIGSGTTIASSLVTLGAGSGDTWNVTAHGLTAGTGVNFTGTLPSAYTVGTPYYVLASGLTVNSFHLSTGGGVGAFAGSPSTSTSSGAGNITMFVPSIENLNLASFDSLAATALPQLSAVSPTHVLGSFSGSALEAIMETPEHGNNGRRIFIRGGRIVTDATSSSVNFSVSQRENAQAVATYSSESTPGLTGWCPQRVSTRFSRGKLRITAGTTWSFAAGIEVDVGNEGLR